MHGMTARDKQNQKDILLTKMRLANFDWNTCKARAYLEGLFEKVNGACLLSLAKVVSEQLGISLDREATRRKSVLYKWFDDNLPMIQDFISTSIVIEMKTGSLLGTDSAVARLSSIRKNGSTETPGTQVS